MQIGDLVRYKHDKYRMGVVLEIIEKRVMDKYRILWNQACQGKTIWCVNADWVQVKGEGRYGWEDVGYEHHESR